MSKVMKQVCTCEKCGNEAEMVVTCAWEDAAVENAPAKPAPRREKGSVTCAHCGNEAEMWIDM